MFCSLQSIRFALLLLHHPYVFYTFTDTVNGIVSLLSFLDYSLQIYRNKTGFVY